MSRSTEEIAPVEGVETETDEALKRIYGEGARISRLGAFTLVHLDDPSPEVLARREEEFNPEEYFMDDCPLCTIAREQGGHIVFDDNTLEAEGGEAEEEVEPGDVVISPGVAFKIALREFAEAVEPLGDRIEKQAPAPLIDRYVEDVEGLVDRISEAIWSDSTPRSIERVEALIERARDGITAVGNTLPALVLERERAAEALDAVAAAWRAI